MGAVPNLFEIEIASELATGEATAKSIALALGSSETLLRAVQLGIDEAKQYNDRDILSPDSFAAELRRHFPRQLQTRCSSTALADLLTLLFRCEPIFCSGDTATGVAE
jgi:hypothetical protein